MPSSRSKLPEFGDFNYLPPSWEAMSSINRGHDLKLLMWGVAAGIVGQAFIDGFDYARRETGFKP